jgi:drug/metabolite transporter (DMT)-like permease
MAVLPICMNLGIWLMSPGRASVLIYSMPIWAALFARLMLAEKLTRGRLAGLALGTAGVVVMASQNLSQLRDAPLGALFTIIAAMSYGLGTVWLKRRAWGADPSVVAFWQLVVGTVPIALVWAFLSAPPDLAQAGPAQWAAMAFIGIVGNGLAYFAWFRIVRMLPAGVSAISAFAVPCVGIASSAWMTGERFHLQDFVAMALIAAAVGSGLADRRLRWRLARGAAL